MTWIFLILAVVIYILFKFFSDLNKDNYDLQGNTVVEKFKVIIDNLNLAAFDGQGQITKFDKRSCSLYQEGKNQFIKLNYATGHLTITWRYKYFQKEVVHEKQYNDVRNISIFDQQKMAEQMIEEMTTVISKHQNSILGSI